MSNLRFEKEIVVKQIEVTLKKAHSLFVANYSGLKVSNLENLRHELKDVESEAKIYKNRLLKLAANKLGLQELSQHLQGPNIFVFGFSEDNKLAKILHKFSQKNPAFVLKGGLWENEIISAEEIVKVANLPSYEEAIAILAFSVLNPLQRLGLSLKLLAESKEETKEETS